MLNILKYNEKNSMTILKKTICVCKKIKLLSIYFSVTMSLFRFIEWDYVRGYYRTV